MKPKLHVKIEPNEPFDDHRILIAGQLIESVLLCPFLSISKTLQVFLNLSQPHSPLSLIYFRNCPSKVPFHQCLCLRCASVCHSPAILSLSLSTSFFISSQSVLPKCILNEEIRFGHTFPDAQLRLDWLRRNAMRISSNFK